MPSGPSECAPGWAGVVAIGRPEPAWLQADRRGAEASLNVAMNGGAVEGLIRVRFAGRCARCAAEVAAGAMARYDRVAKTVTCGDCVARDSSGAGVVPASGAAGASALREFEKRSQRREQRIRRAHPRLGGLILALSEDPQSTRAFKVGGAGESKLGRAFDKLAANGQIVALHDRKVVRPRGQIDHVVVGPAAVYVVDAKNYTGKVHVRSTGFLGLGERRLYVGSRDCSRLAAQMAKQVTAVREALAGLTEAVDLPVVPVLAFVDADWPLLSPPDEFAGVRIEGESVARLVRRPGALAPESRLVVAHRLAQRLSPA